MDTLLENLNILSKIEVNQRLSRTGAKYIICSNTWLRSIQNESRNTTIQMLSADINLALHILKLEYNEQLAVALKTSISGLDNLCGTYVHDSIITEQLRDLINDILKVCADVEVFRKPKYSSCNYATWGVV